MFLPLIPSLAVSLRGYGYLEYPLLSAAKRTDSRLTFATKNTNGLLLLAEGVSKYLIIEMSDSRVVLRLRLSNRTHELRTPEGRSYSDGEWHSVRIQRINAKLKLFVDDAFIDVIRDSPDVAGELELRAIYVGGVENFRKPGLVVMETRGRYFRGCMANVTFNEERLLDGEGRGTVAKGLDWGKCDERTFSDDFHLPAATRSFIPPFAYVKLHKWEARFSGSIEFEFQTSQADGLLFFNGGRLNRTDFVGLELVSGQLRLSVNHGGSAHVDIVAGSELNNRKWHFVNVTLEGRHVILSIDSKVARRKLKGRSRHLDIAGSLFLGGLRGAEAKEARKKGMQSMNVNEGKSRSFAGCMRRLRINGMDVNFDAAKTTRSVSPGCLFEFRCRDDLCAPGETCVDWMDVTSYRCVCEEESLGCGSGDASTPIPSASISVTVLPVDSVPEGGQASLLDHITMKGLADYSLSEVTITVTKQPSFGYLTHTLRRRVGLVSNFTLADVMSGYITYWHDGSENYNDSMTVSIRVTNVSRWNSLQTIDFRVSPLNDGPQLVHPRPGERFSLAAGTCKIIGMDSLLFTDDDNDDSDLVIEILNPGRFEGQFELLTSSGEQLESFTQKDINDGKICFRHVVKTMEMQFSVILRVTDGFKSVVSRFAVHAIRYPLKVTIGAISLAQGSSAAFSSSSIQFQADWLYAQEPPVEVVCQFVELPRFGSIDVINGSRITVDSNLTYGLIARNAVIYVHDPESFSQRDSFKVRFWAGLSSSDIKTVAIDVDVELIRVKTRVLTVREGDQVSLNFESMNITTDPAAKSSLNFFVNVTNTVRHGKLESADVPFSVDALKSGRVVYRHDDSETLNDSFEFFVFASGPLPAGYDESDRQTKQMTFSFVILPVNDEKPEIRIPRELRLYEGTTQVISEEYVKAQDNDTSSNSLVFTVIKSRSVANGFFSFADSIKDETLQFTQKNIDDGRVFFTHVRSKSLKGGFSFVVSDGVHQTTEKRFEIVATPLVLRLVSEPSSKLHVDAEKRPDVVIRSSDLLVVTNDPSQDADVVYHLIKGPSYGHVTNMGIEVASFCPADLETESVRYVLDDPDTMTSFSDLLSVNASIGHSFMLVEVKISILPKPLPYVVTNKGLDVAEGTEGVISSSRLQATDVPNSAPDEIIFTVQRRPRFGRLVERKRDRPTVDTFTQKDINRRKIAYIHTEKNHFVDEVILTISNNRANVSGQQFLIVIYSNEVKVFVRGLVVPEGGRMPITPLALNIEPDHLPFKFLVSDGPQHGRLVLEGTDTLVTTFTLKQLETGSVVYEHDDSETVEDTFEFNVTLRDEIKAAGLLFNISVNLKDDNQPHRIGNGELVVIENRRSVITREVLLYADTDISDDESEIQYRARILSKSFLVRKGEWQTPVTVFSQRDILNEAIYYQNVFSQGEERDMITLIVGPAIAHTFLRVRIVPLALTQNGPKGPIQVREGGKVHLNFNVTVNAAHNVSEILYVVTVKPRYGILSMGDKEVERFTQENILAGLVHYIHSGVDMVSDLFQLRVSYQSKSIDVHVPVTVHPVDDTPPEAVTSETTLYVDEQSNATITNAVLRATDSEQGSSSVVFTVISRSLRRGLILRVNGSTWEEVKNISQADIDAGRIVYAHRDESTRSDRIRFRVSDGRNWSPLPVSVLVEVVPFIVPFEAGTLSVEEGGSVVVTDAFLYAKSDKFRSISLEFIVDRQPVHGTLRLLKSGGKGSRQLAFTSSDLKANRLIYEHDGSEFHNDSFSVMESRRGRVSEPVVVLITIAPVNDQGPVITVNRSLELWAGEVVPITVDNLRAADGDTGASGIVFTVTRLPKNGYLTFKENASSVTNHFTQLDLENGDILFHHEGAMNGDFQFELSDGNHSVVGVFVIIARPLTLSVSINTGLVAQFDQTTLIKSTNLSVRINGLASNRTIVFTVSRLPQFGRLININYPSVEVSNFTLKDIEEDLIGYKYTDIESWKSEDFAYFNVSARLAQRLTDVKFRFRVILKQTPGSALASNNVLVLKEGYVGLISSDHLDAVNIKASHWLQNATVTYNITILPKYGVLMKKNETVALFTQEDINAHYIAYKHDGSETVKDWFEFSLTVHNETWSSEAVVERFDVRITPINDEPRTIVLKPLNLVQGMTRSLTPDDAMVTDRDTLPSELIYKLHFVPAYLSFASVNDTRAILNQFSQEDIDSGKILIRHDGSEMLSGAAIVSVLDGRYKSNVRQWLIFAEKIIVSRPATRAEEHLLQGETRVVVRSEHFNVSTNGNKDDLVFVLIASPRYGQLLLNGTAVRNVTKEDLVDAKLIYVQTNFSSSIDAFTFEVEIPRLGISTLFNFTVSVAVIPLARVNPLVVYAGDKHAAIDVNVIDAEPLFDLTGSNPILTLLRQPAYGVLTLAKTRRIESFTQDQLQKGQIFYEPFVSLNATNSSSSYVDDLVFELSSLGVQPAVLHVQVVFRHISRIVFATPFSENATVISSEYPTSHRLNFTSDTPFSFANYSYPNDSNLNVSSDDDQMTKTIAIAIISAVVFITLCFVGFLLWFKKRKTDEGKEEDKHDGVVASASVEFSPQRARNTDPGVITCSEESDENGKNCDEFAEEDEAENQNNAHDDDDDDDDDEGETDGFSEWETAETDTSTQAPVAPKLQKSEYWV